MNKIHNKEGPDHDVWCHILKLSRDGTNIMAKDKNERMPRDGTVRMARDGTERMPRDGTDVIKWLTRDGALRLARDGIRCIQIVISNQNSESIRIPLKYPIIKPPGKGFFNRGTNFRRRNEIGGKPPFGCGEAELCPEVIWSKNDKFSKFAALEFENMIMNTTY